MIHIGKQADVDAYFEREELSQSKLKLLISGGVHLFNSADDRQAELYYNESVALLIGTAVDCWLTQGKKAYKAQFYVSQLEKKPSDSIMSIVKMVYDNTNMESGWDAPRLHELQDLILEARSHHNYQMRYKDDTVVTKVITEGQDYFQDLVESAERQVLSASQSELIEQIVHNFLTSPVTSRLFTVDENFDSFYQLPIFFELEEVACKALVDVVLIDNDNRTVEPIDIKTLGEHILKFPFAVRKRRYDVQAVWYTKAIESWIQTTKYKDYNILPFKFAVESTKYPGKPCMFMPSREVMMEAYYGRPELCNYGINSDGNHIPFIKKAIRGIHHALEDYKWYIVNGFKEEKIMVEGAGNFIFDQTGKLYPDENPNR